MAGQYFDVNLTEVVYLQSARADRTVVLWERNPAHPGGEVLLAGESIVRGASTLQVCERLSSGTARVVTKEEAEAADRRAAEVGERARAYEAAERKERRRNLFILATGSDKNFEELYQDR